MRGNHQTPHLGYKNGYRRLSGPGRSCIRTEFLLLCLIGQEGQGRYTFSFQNFRCLYLPEHTIEIIRCNACIAIILWRLCCALALSEGGGEHSGSGSRAELADNVGVLASRCSTFLNPVLGTAWGGVTCRSRGHVWGAVREGGEWPPADLRCHQTLRRFSYVPPAGSD